MPSQQNRSYCFTLNNFSALDVQALRSYAKKCRYLVFGYETAPTTGTPHLQGFMQPKTVTRASTVKKHISDQLHIEATEGTPQQAAEYCKKDGNFEEFGVLVDPGQVGRELEIKRWAMLTQLAREHKFEEIENHDPLAFVKCYFSFRAIAKDNLLHVSDLSATSGVWLFGPSGVGKSLSIRSVCAFHSLPLYDKPINKWWDGYRNEPVVLLDDFDKTHSVLGHYLKRWGDSYAFTAEVKNSAIRIRPNLVVVTSQYAIESIWEDEETREAIGRRFTTVYFNDISRALQWVEVQKREKVEFSNRRGI